MIVFMSSAIGLTEAECLELSHRATSRSGRADDGRRARLILLLEAGQLGADPGQAGLQRCVYRPLEQAICVGTAGGAVHSPCRAWREQADAAFGGADPGLDA